MAELSGAKRPTTTPTTLNDLPKELLIRILSFLPIVCAITTSSVSRKWRNLWHFIPSLAFDVTKFPPLPTQSIHEYHQRFADFVTQALLNRPTTVPLHKFILAFYYSYNHRHRSLVTSWLHYALDCHVVDLELNFDIVYNNVNQENGWTESPNDNNSKPFYGFHFFDLMNKSVECLSLRCCEVVMPSNVLIRFESLRVLKLSAVKLDDYSLSYLILRCENLENLVLRYFQGLRKFRIYSESLKVLQLSCYYPKSAEDLESSIEICAPNLSTMKITEFYMANYKGDLSSVAEAELKFLHLHEFQYSQHCWSNLISLLRGVERLTIQNSWLRFMHSKIMSGECFEFKRLKHLELSTGYTLTDMYGLSLLLTRSPLLETLVLDYAYQRDEDASFYDELETRPFCLAVPSLKEVMMKNFKGTHTEYRIIALLGSCNKALKQSVVVRVAVEGTSQSRLLVVNFTPKSCIVERSIDTKREI